MSILTGCVYSTLQRVEIRPNIPIEESDIKYAHEGILTVVKKYDLEPDPWPCKRWEEANPKYCVGYSTKNPEEMRKDLMLIVPNEGYKIFVQVKDSEYENSRKAKNMFKDAVDALNKRGENYNVEVMW